MNNSYRNIAVIIEIENSIKYLRNGLAEIQKVNADNDFYDPTLIYLSGGLERLFKSMLCLNFKQINGRLPNPKEIWNYKQGHDIEFLKREVEKLCIQIDRPFAINDYDLITANPLIDQICKTLSEYGQRARYFNLDAILGTEQEFNSKKEWEEIENIVLKDYYGEKEFFEILRNPNRMNDLYSKLSEILVIKLEEFFRAITRQFIFGNFYEDSRSFIYQIEAFSQMQDHQLGTTDYRKIKNNERIIRK